MTENLWTEKFLTSFVEMKANLKEMDLTFLEVQAKATELSMMQSSSLEKKAKSSQMKAKGMLPQVTSIWIARDDVETLTFVRCEPGHTQRHESPVKQPKQVVS